MTIDFPAGPPRNKKELFERLRGVLKHGPYDMPKTTRYGGHGGPGCLLEDLCGLNAGNRPVGGTILTRGPAITWSIKADAEGVTVTLPGRVVFIPAP